jgi:hypothetical protein
MYEEMMQPNKERSQKKAGPRCPRRKTAIEISSWFERGWYHASFIFTEIIADQTPQRGGLGGAKQTIASTGGHT